MTAFKYPLATSSWDENEIRALEAVIASGQFSMGEYVKRFEEEFNYELDDDTVRSGIRFLDFSFNTEIKARKKIENFELWVKVSLIPSRTCTDVILKYHFEAKNIWFQISYSTSKKCPICYRNVNWV